MPAEDGYGPASLQFLRKAIRANQVVFPSPVPVFACQHRADIQWRLVELYFVQGWSCSRLGERYNVTDRRIQQLIQRWVQRARALGYLQPIPAEESSLTLVTPKKEIPETVYSGMAVPVADVAATAAPARRSA